MKLIFKRPSTELLAIIYKEPNMYIDSKTLNIKTQTQFCIDKKGSLSHWGFSSEQWVIHAFFYKEPVYKEPTCRRPKYLKNLYY